MHKSATVYLGGGRKKQAPEVRDALFQRFIDVRQFLKARLPRFILREWAEELYTEWEKQQDVKIPEDKKLVFSDCWLQGWCEEYCVSLRQGLLKKGKDHSKLASSF